MKKCKIACNEGGTQLCKTSTATTHLDLAGMFCMCTRTRACVSVWCINHEYFLSATQTIYVYSYKLTCKSDPTGLTGHSANTAPPNSSCSQASHLLQVKLLASFRRFSQASLKWHWNCLSSQCLCLFIGWSLKFLQYLRLHFCLSDYNRFKTMAILSDNNRWKYSCREVCAQSKLRWATWEIWE